MRLYTHDLEWLTHTIANRIEDDEWLDAFITTLNNNTYLCIILHSEDNEKVYQKDITKYGVINHKDIKKIYREACVYFFGEVR